MDSASKKYFHSVKSWTRESSHLMGECYDLATPVFLNFPDLDPLVKFVLAQLFLQCHLTSESVIFLVAQDKKWDAAILLRTVLEGTVKYLYILNSNETEIKEKAYEFWFVLPEVADIKHSDRAKIVYDHLHLQKQPFDDLILDEQAHKELLSKYSRGDRRKVEHRWDFLEILRTFENTEMNPLNALSFNYGMYSHLAHMDAIACGMIRERAMRPPVNKTLADLAHVANLIYSVCFLDMLRTEFFLKKVNQRIDAVSRLTEKYKDLYKDLHEAEQLFIRTEHRE